ncbi:MAG: GNAT family N-acetyltransferase [Actinomycetota bacterium]
MPTFAEHIETERLVIRPWVASDALDNTAAVAASLDHLRPWMSWIEVEPLAEADRIELYRSWDILRHAGKEAHYAVRWDGVLVGSVGLHTRVGPGGVDIGYWIHADHLRRGLATEISRGLTDAALATEGVDRVEIHHDEANVASAGVPHKLGYRRGPDLDTEITAPAESGTTWTWIMTPADWADRQRD